jgi:hypothetical protein
MLLDQEYPCLIQSIFIAKLAAQSTQYSFPASQTRVLSSLQWYTGATCGRYAVVGEIWIFPYFRGWLDALFTFFCFFSPQGSYTRLPHTPEKHFLILSITLPSEFRSGHSIGAWKSQRVSEQGILDHPIVRCFLLSKSSIPREPWWA